VNFVIVKCRFVDAQVEDSGRYSCSVPVLDEVKRVDLFVVCKSVNLKEGSRHIMNYTLKWQFANLPFAKWSSVQFMCCELSFVL